MSNQITTQTLSFHGSDLITLKVEDVIYTAVRPIVEALGLSWSTQKQKLDKSKDKFGCVHMNTPTNGGMQSMLCMPIKKLNGWLFSINPERVRADLKEKVISYQEECFEALYNYWHFGKAERQPSLPLISAEKFIDIRISESDIRELAWIWFAGQQMADFISNLIRPLELLGSTDAPRAYSYANEYGNLLSGSIDLIEQLTLGVHFDNPTPLKRLKQAKEHREHRRQMVLNSREMVERATQNTRLGKR